MVDVTKIQQKASTALGVGIAFPFHFTERGGVAVSSGVDHIRDGITQCLVTAFAERVMIRRFGAHLQKYLFSTDYDLLNTQVVSDIHNVLQKWERRITLDDVSTKIYKNNVMEVYIEYTVIQTNDTGSIVWPFSLKGN